MEKNKIESFENEVYEILSKNFKYDSLNKFTMGSNLVYFILNLDEDLYQIRVKKKNLSILDRYGNMFIPKLSLKNLSKINLYDTTSERNFSL